MKQRLTRNQHCVNFLLSLALVVVVLWVGLDLDVSEFPLWVQIVTALIVFIGGAIGGVSMLYSLKALYKIDKRAEKFGKK